MLNTGYIKLHRSLLDWEWYHDLNTRILFLHLLLTANYEDKKWMGMVVKRGQRVCSYKGLSQESGLSLQSVRTALNHLKSTGEVTYQAAPQYGLITISNYEKYQGLTDQPTNEQQAANKQLTNDQQQLKKDKEVKKDKKERIPPKSPQGFDAFWEAYPRKQSKAAALKAYQKIKPDGELLGVMLSVIERQKTSDQWRRDNGQYIPHPATWLNGRRWEDEGEGSTTRTNNPFLRMLREEESHG